MGDVEPWDRLLGFLPDVYERNHSDNENDDWKALQSLQI